MNTKPDLRTLLLWLPGALVVVWWIRDLSHLWASLVEYRFGWVVVLLTGFLVWERWPTRPTTPGPRPLWLILGLGAAGFGFVLMGELYRIGLSRASGQALLLSLGCASFIAAHLVGIGGTNLARHFRFPLLFFFVAVPIPKILWNPILLGLQELVAVLNVESLQAMGIPAIRRGSVIQLPNTLVGVDEACSGIRSLQSTLMAALFIGDLTLKRWGSKTFLFVAGILLAVIGNWGRSLFLSLAAHRGGSDALNAVHDSAGWTVLLFTATGVAVLSWIMVRIDAHARSRSA